MICADGVKRFWRHDWEKWEQCGEISITERRIDDPLNESREVRKDFLLQRTCKRCGMKEHHRSTV